MSTPLTGQVALITGANQGIGLHIAIALAREGVSLILFNRTAHKLSALTTAVPSATYHEEQVDITDADQVTAAVISAAHKFERIDILINNAGIALGAPHSLWEQDLGAIQKVLGTNVLGTVNVTHAVMRRFLIPQKRGTVLNVSSTTALEAPPVGFGEVSCHALLAYFVDDCLGGVWVLSVE